MDIEKLWKTVLAEIELTVSKATYQTHFTQTRLVSVIDDTATVGLPSPLIRTLVETRYHSLIKSILEHHLHKDISLVFTILSSQPSTKTRAPVGPLFEPQQSDTSAVARRLHIRSESTFDTFAVSTTNQLAFAAATAVAKNIGTAYNPLFLYGGVGVGKTHLMHAVANSILLQNPRLHMVYCMGEEFLNEIVEAIQTKTARQFKQKYRSAKLLMVDDVQFIAGKQTAQEEFFHTFNAVHREGGQIILTSDRPPSEIARLEDRLRSRFEGGLTVDVAPPDFELRAAIVHIKSDALGLSVPPEAAQIIAANVTDTRAIEGFLRRLTAYVQAGKAITSDLISSILGTRDNPSTSAAAAKKRVSPQEVLEAVSAYFELKPTLLKGPKRDRPIARSRQLVMYLCKLELGMTLDDIGGLLGGRDHSTVLHGIETITQELSTNERLRDAIVWIKQKLWA